MKVRMRMMMMRKFNYDAIKLSFVCPFFKKKKDKEKAENNKILN